MNLVSLYAVEYHSLSPTQLRSLVGEDSGMQIHSQEILLQGGVPIYDKSETVGDTVLHSCPFLVCSWPILCHTHLHCTKIPLSYGNATTISFGILDSLYFLYPHFS